MSTNKLKTDDKRTVKWALQIADEIEEAGGEAEERLRDKCRWEQRSRTAVILEWGDPRGWD